MGKTTNYKLPRAQVARLQRGPAAAVAGILRPLARLRVGRTELVAASIAGGILVMTGLMLAAFGAANQQGLAARYTAAAPAANQQGLAERYTASAPADSDDGAGDLNSLCRYDDANAEPCEDIWDRAMAGGKVEQWNGHDDWMESQCRVSRQCYQSAPPTRERAAPLAVLTNMPKEFEDRNFLSCLDAYDMFSFPNSGWNSYFPPSALPPGLPSGAGDR
jgi:hypothetical protein